MKHGILVGKNWELGIPSWRKGKVEYNTWLNENMVLND